MSGIQDFVALIAGHGTFLLLLLPIVGAVLVAVSAPFGAEVVRRTAFTNVCLSVGIAFLMLIHFRIPSSSDTDSGRRFQMAGEANLELGISQQNREKPLEKKIPDDALLKISVGVDGMNLWILVLIPVVLISAVREVPDSANAAGFLVPLLLMEACLVGVFAATDAIFFVICLEGTGLLLFYLIGRFGTPDHRRELSLLAIAQMAGGLLIFLGLAALALAHWHFTAAGSDDEHALSFSLISLVSTLPPDLREATPAASFRDMAEPTIFWCMTVGFLMWSALFPFHGRFCENGAPWPVSVSMLAYGVLPCLAAFGFLRWILPVCPTAAESAAAFLVPTSLWGAIVCALLALKQTDLKRMVAYASVSHAGLSFAAIATLTAAGLHGGVMHLIGHVAGFAMLAIAVATHREHATSRCTAALILLAGVAICGLPLLSGFPSQWLAFNGFRQFGESSGGGLYAVVMAGSVMILLAWTFLRAGMEAVSTAHANRRSQRAESGNSERTRTIVAEVLLLVVLLLSLGLAPQFVVDRLTPALREISPKSFASSTAKAEDSP